MLAHTLTLARPLAHRTLPLLRTASAVRTFRVGVRQDPYITDYPNLDATTDPDMNGGYHNPTAEKRQFRDPYGDWWDKQGRRNYGEALHEDDDILGRFTPEEYTHFKPKTAFALNGAFILAMLGLCGTVYVFYPDKPAVPRTFPYNGLEAALGGKKALPALSDKND